MTAKPKGQIWPWLLLILAIGTGAAYLFFKSSPGLPGIDVSHYQGKINWEEVAAEGVAFSFIKASEGKSMVDDHFARNWTAAKAAGLRRGAYHFFRPSVDAAAQARNFLAQYKPVAGDLPPVLDLEVTDRRSASQIRKACLEWMQIVERATGQRPILYTMPRFANDYLSPEITQQYTLWLVDLGWREPHLPKGIDDWVFWQYSHHGHIEGIEGEVDLNYFQGDLTALDELCK